MEAEAIPEEYRKARKIWSALLLLYLPLGFPIEIGLFKFFDSMIPVLLFAGLWVLAYLFAWRRVLALRHELRK